jgi:hypothetical protein
MNRKITAAVFVVTAFSAAWTGAPMAHSVPAQQHENPAEEWWAGGLVKLWETDLCLTAPDNEEEKLLTIEFCPIAPAPEKETPRSQNWLLYRYGNEDEEVTRGDISLIEPPGYYVGYSTKGNLTDVALSRYPLSIAFVRISDGPRKPDYWKLENAAGLCLSVKFNNKNTAVRWLPCTAKAVSRYWSLGSWSHHDLPVGE